MRAYHRVAGALLAAQLAAWVLTGMLFNVKYRYDEAYEALAPVPAATDQDAHWISPGDAVTAAGVTPATLRRVRLLHDNRGYIYLVESGTDSEPQVALVDARTGQAVQPLDAAAAEAALRSALSASKHAARYGLVKTALVAPSESALLGRSTPGWQLVLDSGQTVTVNAYTSEISHTALLNTAIDWSYRVHYMQYTPWKSVNIAIISIFSLLLVSLVASGITILTEGRRRRYGYGARKLHF